jgi:hypothetical protein
MHKLGRNRYAATPARRRGRHAMMALLAVGVLGCGEDSTGPTAPGSIVVKTETTGFLKAEGYDVVVDGVNTTTIGANDEVTVPDLAPGSYLVELAGVADNCTVEGILVAVESEQSAEVTLPVTCTHADAVAFSVQFSRERPDLETEAITVCSFGICPTQEEWDLYVQSSSASEIRSIIRQNENAGVQIAHLPGVTLESLTEADFAGATFTTEPIDDPFDSGRVILIQTDLGNVYALGNPSEDITSSTLNFDAALIARATQ